jgi:hypothetical protein
MFVETNCMSANNSNCIAISKRVRAASIFVVAPKFSRRVAETVSLSTLVSGSGEERIRYVEA